MENLSISVVMPVFNPGEILGETIDSVLHQTFGNFELIVVDDGSTDAATLSVIARQTDVRIRIIR